MPRGEDAPRRTTTCWSTTWISSAFDIEDFNGAHRRRRMAGRLGDNVRRRAGRRLLLEQPCRRVYSGFRERRTAPRSSRTSSCASCRSPRPSGSCRSATIDGIQPYIGAGVGVLRWRYSETGRVRRSATTSIFRGNFVGSGAATGPVDSRRRPRSGRIGGRRRRDPAISRPKAICRPIRTSPGRRSISAASTICFTMQLQVLKGSGLRAQGHGLSLA